MKVTITNQNIFVIFNHAILYSYYAKSVMFALARHSMPIYSKIHQNRVDGWMDLLSFPQKNRSII